MDEEKKDYKDLLEKIAEDDTKDLIYLLIGSLISADNVVDVDTCKNSINMLTDLKAALIDISDSYYTQDEKDKLIEFCDNGIDICNRDLEVFIKNEKGE